MEFDKDLCSIQEVRCLIKKAQTALEEYAGFSQEQVDKITKAIAEAGAANAERLAKMAVEETGFGIWQDKVLKNLLGSGFRWIELYEANRAVLRNPNIIRVGTVLTIPGK